MAAMYNRAFFVLSVLIHLSVTRADHERDAITSQYMLNFCGSTFYMAQKNVHETLLELTNTDHYGNNIDCEMTIVTSPFHRIFVNFISVGLDDCNDWIRLYGDSTHSSNVISPQICFEKHDVYSTDDNKAVLKFHSDGSLDHGHFKILMTSFYEPTGSDCAGDYFKCKGKHRCIKSDLVCNARDNCGDDSDEDEDNEECDDHRWWIILSSVLGSLFFITGISLIICCVCYKKKKVASKGRVHATMAGHPPASSTFPNQHHQQAFTSTNTTVSYRTQPFATKSSTSPPPPYSALPSLTPGQPYSDPSEGKVPGPAVYIPPYYENR